MILKVVEPNKNKLNGPDDFYGAYINELFSGIGIIYASLFCKLYKHLQIC